MVLPLKFIRQLLLTFSVLLLLAGCESATVVEDRSQREAMEAVSILHAHGIEASTTKDRGGRGKYSVVVSARHRAQANELLFQNGIPRESEVTFDELIAQRGLIPNSKEVEALRVERAMAVELEEALRNFPAVRAAKVIIRRTGDGKASGTEASQPSVSVVVQTVPGVQIKREEIEDLVARAVPGLPKERLSISIGEQAAGATLSSNDGVLNSGGTVVRKTLVPFLFWYWVPEDNYVSLTLMICGCLALVLILGVIGGYWYGYYQQSRGFFENEGGNDIVHRSLKFDRPKKDLPM